MGKKSGSNGGGEKGKVAAAAARAFVLKVAMHCDCQGCTDKIRAAVRGLTLLQGVEAVDQSAVESTGEVKLLATADPEKLRQRLHKATNKHVDLVFPKEPKPAKKDDHLAAAQALLAELQQHQHQQQAPGQYGHGAWASQQQQQQLLGMGSGWNAGNYGAAAQAAYPWAAASSYPAAPAAAWGQYVYPPAPAPAQGHGHGGYYGGAPAWHGY